MAGGHVNRALLQQYYQNPGDTYDDAMTEGAYEVLAQQIDDNWDEYAAHKTAPEIDHPDGSVTGRKIRNGTITADKFVPGALTNETQNALRITQLENNFGAHAAKSVTDAGGVHGFRVETGTFTPVLAGTVTPGNNTYSVQTGRYVKVGRVVHFFVQLNLASKDPNMFGAVVISGLPFTVDGASAATIAYYRFVNRTTDHQLGGRIEGPAQISLWENGVNVGPKSLSTTQITDTSQFMVSGVYLTNQ